MTVTSETKKARERIEKGRRASWWRRIGSRSKGFDYIDAAGKRVTGSYAIDRIRSLVIPPAWKYVRINPAAGGRIQAVGMDSLGRVQYLYNAAFTEKQQRRKFAKIEGFGCYLPKLRETTTRHLSLEGYPREKVLAAILRLISSLYFRVGTEGSLRDHGTVGITTLKNQHLTIGKKGALTFEFVGKSHVQHHKVLVDEELATILKGLKEIGPKRKLFHYVDDVGKVHSIKPAEINKYLKSVTSDEFSSKDFRTWGATLLAAVKLAEVGPAGSETEAKKNIVKVVRRVAEELGNTPAVCRNSYIHPVVLTAYEEGTTLNEFRPKKHRRITGRQTNYEPEEMALLRLLNAV